MITSVISGDRNQNRQYCRSMNNSFKYFPHPKTIPKQQQPGFRQISDGKLLIIVSYFHCPPGLLYAGNTCPFKNTIETDQQYLLKTPYENKSFKHMNQNNHYIRFCIQKQFVSDIIAVHTNTKYTTARSQTITSHSRMIQYTSTS